MVLNRAADVHRAIVLLLQIRHNAMIIPANADANRVSLDEHVIDVYQATGITHRKDAYVSKLIEH